MAKTENSRSGINELYPPVGHAEAAAFGGSGVLGGLLVGFSFLGGGTFGVGGHGDDEGDADVEEVDDRKRAVA